MHYYLKQSKFFWKPPLILLRFIPHVLIGKVWSFCVGTQKNSAPRLRIYVPNAHWQGLEFLHRHAETLHPTIMFFVHIYAHWQSFSFCVVTKENAAPLLCFCAYIRTLASFGVSARYSKKLRATITFLRIYTHICNKVWNFYVGTLGEKRTPLFFFFFFFFFFCAYIRISARFGPSALVGRKTPGHYFVVCADWQALKFLRRYAEKLHATIMPLHIAHWRIWTNLESLRICANTPLGWIILKIIYWKEKETHGRVFSFLFKPFFTVFTIATHFYRLSCECEPRVYESLVDVLSNQCVKSFNRALHSALHGQYGKPKFRAKQACLNLKHKISSHHLVHFNDTQRSSILLPIFRFIFTLLWTFFQSWYDWLMFRGVGQLALLMQGQRQQQVANHFGVNVSTI